LFFFPLELPEFLKNLQDKMSFVKVDILDTSGDGQFPAMRRLSIATAHAFLLVYSVTSAPSLTAVKQCFEEIKEQRADFQVRRKLISLIN
jgi:GTPase SAR1 family protein